MFWSRNKYFHQSTQKLKANWDIIEMYLEGNGLNVVYFKYAYDHFCKYPEGFDGATIVKDLVDIFDLDLSAMRHDYDYYLLKKMKGFTWLKYKLKVDYDYGKNMERLGKGIANTYLRSFLLWLSTPFYLLIILFKK